MRRVRGGAHLGRWRDGVWGLPGDAGGGIASAAAGERLGVRGLRLLLHSRVSRRLRLSHHHHGVSTNYVEGENDVDFDGAKKHNSTSRSHNVRRHQRIRNIFCDRSSNASDDTC